MMDHHVLPFISFTSRTSHHPSSWICGWSQGWLSDPCVSVQGSLCTVKAQFYSHTALPLAVATSDISVSKVSEESSAMCLGLHDSLPQNVMIIITFIWVKQPSCHEVTFGTYPWPHAPQGRVSHIGGHISGHTHNAFQSKELSCKWCLWANVWMEPMNAHSFLSRFLC